jgi:diamine N-acetyltransferase
MQTGLELIELGSRAREFLKLEVADHQKHLVSTVAESFADALFQADDGWDNSTTWIRGVTRDGVPAAFIMCADSPVPEIDPWIWRLLVDRDHQGVGVGTFAMNCAIERYRAMGFKRIRICWYPAEDDSSGFYKKFGFKETGELWDDEVVAALEL